MKLEQIKTDIAKMSEDELREFILENRKAQKRYKDEQANQPKRVKVSSVTEKKSQEDKIKALIQGMDPELLKKLLDEKGI
tara:strand:- start:2152 stop:2391 length:240 start_codon:yes stop_codon:yes gene_type:complete